LSRKVTVTRRIIGVAIGAVALLLGLIVVVLLLVTPAEPQPGYRLAFFHHSKEDTNTRVCIASPDGSDVRQGPEASMYFSFLSPDGRWLAIYEIASWDHWRQIPIGVLEIVYVPTGEVVHHLNDLELCLPNVSCDTFLAWSPDSMALAYLSSPAGQVGIDTWVYDLATGTAINVVHNEGHRNIMDWSPDSEWVILIAPVMVVRKAPNRSQIGFWNIETVRANGSERRIIADMYAAGFDVELFTFVPPLCNLAWSPDGDYITFEDSCGGVSLGRRLFVAATDGSGVHLLLDMTIENKRESIQVHYDTWWSPSGDRLRIAYAQQIVTRLAYPLFYLPTSVEEIGVVVFDGDTFSIVERAEPLDFHSTSVSWSPDGRFLLLWKDYFRRGTPTHPIAVAEFSDGQLSLFDLAAELPAGACSSPQWSPDGRYIVYAGSNASDDLCPYDHGESIVTISFPDGHVTDVTASLGTNNRLIGWIPDTSDRP